MTLKEWLTALTVTLLVLLLIFGVAYLGHWIRG
jgi:hypothetical protein